MRWWWLLFKFFLLAVQCVCLLSGDKLHQLPIATCLDLTELNLEEEYHYDYHTKSTPDL